MKVKAAQSSLTRFDSMGCILKARILQWVVFPSPRNLPHPGIEPRSPTLLADSLPAEPQRICQEMRKCLVFYFYFIRIEQPKNMLVYSVVVSLVMILINFFTF